jgi:putative FmdB family regulatory protein
MPIIPFECVACRVEFERITLRVSQDPDPTCPACGQPAERRFGVPLLKTDTAWQVGARYGGEQFAGSSPEERDLYVGTAERAGVSVNGKVYLHGLARFAGDPEAWVSDLGDVDRVARRRGMGCEERGIKPRQAEPRAAGVADDVVHNEVAAMIDGGALDSREVTRDVVDAVRDRIDPKYKPGTCHDAPPVFSVPGG